jgi:hypothetical protein
MKDKYSLAKCEQYGRRLAARLCEEYFGPQPTATLDGPAVLKFTPVRQVNLLVARQLLGQWQAETSRLRSPYFDFEAAPVQVALTQFMNVLSRHIHLTRTTYEPLLAQAAADTLGIVADPSSTFEQLLLGSTTTPTVAGLRENLRYFDIDKDFYTGFVDSLPASGELSRDFLLHRFELYHAANYKAHQPLQRLVSTLSALLPLTQADLREDGPVASPAPPPAAPVAVPPAKVEPIPTPVPVVETPAAPTPAPVEPLPVAIPTFIAPAAPAAATIPMPQPEPSLSAPAAPASSPSLPGAEPAGVPLHEKLKANQPLTTPLAHSLRASASPAPLGERSAPKVETLREAISINQRFSFINELFNGENMEYHAAVQHLDALPSAEEARAYVTDNLAQRYDWSRKEEHVNKLLKLIERKFA